MNHYSRIGSSKMLEMSKCDSLDEAIASITTEASRCGVSVKQEYDARLRDVVLWFAGEKDAMERLRSVYALPMKTNAVESAE